MRIENCTWHGPAWQGQAWHGGARQGKAGQGKVFNFEEAMPVKLTKGSKLAAHCCDRCVQAAGLKPRRPADSGRESWRCNMCGHFGIGSFMVCEVGDWLVLRPLSYRTCETPVTIVNGYVSEITART